MPEPHLFVLDGGGSSCRAALYSTDGQERGRATGGFANLTSDFETSHTHIERVIAATYRAAARPPTAQVHDIAVLGVAGAEFGDAADRLRTLLPFADTTVLSDRHTSMAGILGRGDGTLAQIGTGSFFISRTAGRRVEIGGWGLILGDECSGAWLGRELLRTALRALDGIEPDTDLTRRVRARHGDDPRAVVLFASTATPGAFAELAPDIFAATTTGDPAASAILSRAIVDLERCLHVLSGDTDQPIYLCGGVGRHYAPMLAPALRSRLREPQGDGLSGALGLARARLRDA